jgi:hypothetical protein
MKYEKKIAINIYERNSGYCCILISVSFNCFKISKMLKVSHHQNLRSYYNIRVFTHTTHSLELPIFESSKNSIHNMFSYQYVQENICVFVFIQLFRLIDCYYSKKKNILINLSFQLFMYEVLKVLDFCFIFHSGVNFTTEAAFLLSSYQSSPANRRHIFICHDYGWNKSLIFSIMYMVGLCAQHAIKKYLFCATAYFCGLENTKKKKINQRLCNWWREINLFFFFVFLLSYQIKLMCICMEPTEVMLFYWHFKFNKQHFSFISFLLYKVM